MLKCHQVSKNTKCLVHSRGLINITYYYYRKETAEFTLKSQSEIPFQEDDKILTCFVKTSTLPNLSLHLVKMELLVLRLNLSLLLSPTLTAVSPQCWDQALLTPGSASRSQALL